MKNSHGDPVFISNSLQENNIWKANLAKKKCGDFFEWTLEGWDSSYEVNAVTICVEVGEEGKIGCTKGNCINSNKRWFGKAINTRGEFNVHKHVCSYHRPLKKTKGTDIRAATKRKSSGSSTIITSYFTVASPKATKQQRKESPPMSDIVTTRSASLVSPLLSGGEAPRTPTMAMSPIKICNSYERTAPFPQEPSNAVSVSSKDTTMLSRRLDHQTPNWVLELWRRSRGSCSDLVRCPGVNIDIPEPRDQNFPMNIHNVISDIPFVFDHDIKNVRASQCNMWFAVDLENFKESLRCKPCSELSSLPVLKNIADRAKQDELHESRIANAYLTSSQIEKKLKQFVDQQNESKLGQLNSCRQIMRMCTRLDLHKRLFIAMTRGDIPRQHQILLRVFQEGRSMDTCLTWIHSAIAGDFRPKGYTVNELDEQILVLRMGSQRLLYALNHSQFSAGASARTIKRMAYVPNFQPLNSDIEKDIVLANFERFMFSDAMTSELDKKKCLWTMQVDDVKCEKRVRVDERTGRVVGLCYHAHKNSVSTELKTFDDCKAISAALDDGEAHYGTEMTTVAFGPNRENQYQITVVAESPGCLNNDPEERTLRLVKMCIEIYVTDPRGEALRGRLSTLQPDGASTFVKIGQKLFFEKPMTSDHPLHKQLSKLPLFNMYSGSGYCKQMTMGCEQKHAFKRTRERLKSETKGCTFFEYPWKGTTLQSFLLASGEKKPDVQRMFAKGYADAMNVPAMIDLYKAIADMADKEPSEFGNLQMQVRTLWKELQLLGAYCGLIHSLLCDKVSLGQHLETISAIMHINLVCYRRNGTNMIPGQNFANQQRYHRSIYWSVANAIEDGIDEYFIFLDSGDRLEEFFGLQRTLSGGASGTGDGMDCLQCSERTSGVMQCMGVLSRKPHLGKSSKHLKTTKDHQNPRSYLSTGGRNAAQDKSRVEIKQVNLQSRYMQGRRSANKVLQAAGYPEDELDWNKMREESIDMLRPRGNFVGIGTLDDEEDEVGIGAVDDEEDEGKKEAKHSTFNHVSEAVLFEESLGAVPPDDDDNTDTAMCKKTFEVNGKQMSAGACLRHALKIESASETSRVSRYQGKVRSGTAVQDVNDHFSDIADLIRASEDPIATIVVTKSKQGQYLALAIVSPDSFILQARPQPVTEISPNDFKGRTKISGKLIPVTASSEEISWNIQAKSMITIEFYATNSTLLNPKYRVINKKVVGENTKEQITEYYVDLKTAEDVLSKLRLEYNTSIVLPNLSKYPTHIPYSCNSKPILCSVIEDSAPVLSSRSAKTDVRDENIEVRCGVPTCNLIFNITKIRHHSAWHIKYDKDLSSKVGGILVTNLCGICASGKATTYTKDAPDGVCSAWLEKVRGAKTMHFKHTCRKHPIAKVKSYAAALTPSKANPSTNVPIECPECSHLGGKGKEQHFFKYNFESHWKTIHPQIDMPVSLKEAIKVRDDEMGWLKSFDQPKVSYSKKKQPRARSSRKTPKKDMSGMKTSDSKPESAASVPLPVLDRGKKTGLDSDVPILLLKPITRSMKSKVNSMIQVAFETRDNPPFWYTYRMETVTMKSLSTLRGSEFIGDEVVNMTNHILNDRNAGNIKSNQNYRRCYIVNSFFCTRLLGQKEVLVSSPNFLGVNDQEIPFDSTVAEQNLLQLQRHPSIWSRKLFGTAGDKPRNALLTVFDIVKDKGLNMLIFQVNIALYHWFFVSVNFEKGQIIVHDSLINPLLNEKVKTNRSCDISKSGVSILSCLTDTRLGDLMESNLLQLCEMVGICVGRNKTETLHRLMRPMIAQELFRFVSLENERTKVENQIDISKWKLCLSPDFPQQNPGTNACALFTTAGSDVLSSGGDVSMIDGTTLEEQGRQKMAEMCCLDYGKKAMKQF